MGFYLRITSILLSLSLSLQGCTQLDIVRSSLLRGGSYTLPSWIELMDSSLSKSNLIYLRINEGAIWEPGDDVITLGEQIAQSLRVKIDGSVLAGDKVFTLDTLSQPIYMYNERGNIIGSHKGSWDLFFAVSTSPGLHIATVEIISTSGRIFTYSWIFEVGQGIETPSN